MIRIPFCIERQFWREILDLDELYGIIARYPHTCFVECTIFGQPCLTAFVRRRNVRLLNCVLEYREDGAMVRNVINGGINLGARNCRTMLVRLHTLS